MDIVLVVYVIAMMGIMDLIVPKLAVIRDNTMFQPTILAIQPVLPVTTAINFHIVVSHAKHLAQNVSTVARIVSVAKLSME
jgi:hypothetical protein